MNAPIEEQLTWIEKVPDELDCLVPEEKINTEDEFILKHCVSDYELNANKTSETGVKSDFVKKYGILKEKFSKEIKGKKYVLQSVHTNDRNHDTYYLFVFNEEE